VVLCLQDADLRAIMAQWASQLKALAEDVRTAARDVIRRPSAEVLELQRLYALGGPAENGAAPIPVDHDALRLAIVVTRDGGHGFVRSFGVEWDQDNLPSDLEDERSGVAASWEQVGGVLVDVEPSTSDLRSVLRGVWSGLNRYVVTRIDGGSIQ
jgi:hypothetical protein